MDMQKIMIGILSILMLLTGCSRKPARCGEFLLNTYVTVTVLSGGGEQEAQNAIELCRHYEKIFSCTDPESELYRLNHRELTEVSDELAEVIALGLQISQLSGGAFDLTAGGLTALWDFNAPEPKTPEPDRIQEELSHIGWEKLRLEGNQVIFLDPNTTIDLGGIAKGYIADRLAEHLRADGVDAALLDLGGNLYCLGAKPGGEPFHIGIQHPERERNEALGGISVTDTSVVTSGVYERSFTENGTLYHHILDTKTGWPVQNGLLSVTIVTDSSAMADALSTAVFAMGLQEGTALVESLADTDAIFVTDELEVFVTTGLQDSFQPTEGCTYDPL